MRVRCTDDAYLVIVNSSTRQVELRGHVPGSAVEVQSEGVRVTRARWYLGLC